MLEILVEGPAASPATRCWVARCAGRPAHTPILHIALLGTARLSRVTLPAPVCGEHRQPFADRFLSAARRTSIEAALRARGRAAPDWARTTIDFA